MTIIPVALVAWAAGLMIVIGIFILRGRNNGL